MSIEIKKGRASPLGTSPLENGVNFALFTENSSPLFLKVQDIKTLDVILQEEVTAFTGSIRHILVKGLPSSFIYSFILNGYELLDPFAKKIASPLHFENLPYVPRAFYRQGIPFDWQEDTRPNIPLKDLVIYEMHVRGFTQDPSSTVQLPGTYLGLIEKIPHLKELGINAVELLPIHEFNPYEPHPENKFFGGKLKQYWGYSTVNFFSPANGYAHESALIEFKEMVRALHAAKIEVILDVVFNHTAEGNEGGPIQGFKEFGKKAYYILEDEAFANYSGCGNTCSCNHPVMIQLIMKSLEYWVEEMHVDGFRFDLASIFYRGSQGEVLIKPPLLEILSKNPLLANTKLIAEPWDAAGLYQLGHFFPESARFSEWNAAYRDVIRQFISGKNGLKGHFATCLSGSEDLFSSYGRSPQNSINFIVSHDGFTLADLVSYNEKHNFDNGEANRDGMNNNYSWNCGVEGVTEDSSILQLRERQMRNLHLALMLSQGVPMLHMGDEYGHTKKGNNNTWCQDNTLSWFLWDQLKNNPDFFQFYKGLIHFRKITPVLKHDTFLKEQDICWHGKSPFDPGWNREDQFIAFTLLEKGNPYLYAAFNAGPDAATVHFPPAAENQVWRIMSDSGKLAFYDPPIACPEAYEMTPYSSLLLLSS